MAYTELTSEQTNAKSPIDEALMHTTSGINNNLRNHETRILALEAGGSGGTSGDIGKYATLLCDPNTLDNVGINWKRRFHVFQSSVQNGANTEGVDWFNKNKNDFFLFSEENDNGLAMVTSGDDYLGQNMEINKSSKLSFILKENMNYFGISTVLSSGASDSITITVDGNSVTTSGLVDETKTARANTYSTNVTPTRRQHTEWFYGGVLNDAKEHVITIENTDSASKTMFMDSVWVGYKTPAPCINKTIHVNAGRAAVNGSETAFDEDDISFSASDNFGHTAAAVLATDGNITALDGVEGAMTQVRAEKTVAFSGAVTTLPVKSSRSFPSNGICLLSSPLGNHHMFSYNAKTETSVAANSLDGIVWNSKPSTDFVTCNNFTGAVGTGTGDLNINLIAEAPSELVITSSNNRIDFSINYQGTLTTYAATIPSGVYSADLMPIGPVIVAALESARSLDSGRYICDYNETSRRWRIGVSAEAEVTELRLLFSSGTNQANSVHSGMGYADSDLSSGTSYVATSDKAHLARRAHRFDPVFMHGMDPRVKASVATSTPGVGDAISIEELYGIGHVRTVGNGNLLQISPDPDCCGLTLHFLAHYNCGMISAQIDNSPFIYLVQPDSGSTTTTDRNRGRIISAMVTFPRGSKDIILRVESNGCFNITGTTDNMYFVGARQMFSKPKIEALGTDQAILRSYDIAPKQLFATFYSHNGGTLYSPSATDNVDAIAETGSWAGTGATAAINGNRRFSSTNNDYVEVDFTLAGDGGGIMFKTVMASSHCIKLGLFVNTQVAGITEGTDRMMNTSAKINIASWYGRNIAGHTDLPAGSYTARLKLEDPANLSRTGFTIIDTVPPEANKYTISDITGAGQGIAYPLNVRRAPCMEDANDRVPSFLFRSGYKEGRPTSAFNDFEAISVFNEDDSSVLFTSRDGRYFSNQIGTSGVNSEMKFVDFCKSYSPMMIAETGYTTTITPYVDGRSTTNNFSLRVTVKSGTSPSTIRSAPFRPFVKAFYMAIAHSAGNVYTCADTRGIKVDDLVEIYDGTSYEVFTVKTVTTDTSLETYRSPAVIIAANAETVFFPGYHAMRLLNGNANPFYISAFEYEPLDTMLSRDKIRLAENKKTEVVSTFNDAIGTGGDMFYPYHSDGINGNWSTSSIDIIGKTATSNTYSIPTDLKNIVVSGGTLDIKITSTREVPDIPDEEIF